MALKHDATSSDLEVTCTLWDADGESVTFTADDPDLIRAWARDLYAEANRLEQAQRDAEAHICPACNGSGEDPLAPAGEGRCRECHGSGEVTGE